jgi:hypothetical protein
MQSSGSGSGNEVSLPKRTEVQALSMRSQFDSEAWIAFNSHKIPFRIKVAA